MLFKIDNMKRVFIIHRWSGSPLEDWIPWLKGVLEERGYKVSVPEMPDTDNPVIEKWVAHLSKIVGVPDSNTYFIGHSIGCQTVLRYLESLNNPIGGALFVAGWFNLKNLEDDETETLAKPWIETPIDIEKIKKVLPKSTLIISENDPYDAFEENIKRFNKFVTKQVVLKDAGHITDEQEPEILNQFLELNR